MAKILDITQRPLPVFTPAGGVIESVEITVSLDTGSTFTMTIPRDQYDQQAVEQEIRARAAHILAVDALRGTEL